MNDETFAAILSILFILISVSMSLAAYLLPALVAYTRKHTNRTAILVANFLFGWTVIGWGVCLIWAFTSNEKRES